MKLLVLVIAWVVGLAATSEAQVYKPRGKGPALIKKADLAAAAKADPATAKTDPKPTAAVKSTSMITRKVTQPAKSRVTRDSRPDDLTPDPPKKKAKKAKKHKSDDDDVQVSDDDDDVKVSDD